MLNKWTKTPFVAEERTRSFTDWQATWEAEPKRTLNSGVYSRSTSMDRGGTGIFLGYGYYRKDLQKLSKPERPGCLYYPGVAATAEHCIFACASGMFIGFRVNCPELTLENMLRGQRTRNQVVSFSDAVLKATLLYLGRP